ncbi:MAG: 4Fe-4S binding protein [Eubacteriaceae bacterium]
MKNRKWIQGFFFILILMIVVNHILVEAGKGIAYFSSFSLHAICPFGGVVTLYQFFTTGTFVQKIHESSVILMFLVFLMSVLFGSVFCGWICPFGTFQEWSSKIGKKIFKRKYNNFISKKLDYYLRFIRYIVLVWIIYNTAMTAKLVFINIDPYYALFHFWTGEVAVSALFILGIVLLSSIFIERPWCKYLCPYGAILGLSNKISIFKIVRNKSKCISCMSCDKNCPMNIIVSKQEIINNHQCIRCMECTSEANCPIENTVELSSRKNNTILDEKSTGGRV